MKIKILYILTGISFLMGCGTFMASESAIHEIEAILCFILAAVLLTGTLIVKALDAQMEEE